MRRFREGGSICTFTVANSETLAAAQRDLEPHNLVRVRMGGWTEFFITLLRNMSGGYHLMPPASPE